MSRDHLIPSAELHALRDLELVTRKTVEGLRQGLHRSPFHGYSAEFSQYRHYRPGDDLKYVDWKAFARTDRVYTRQFRETTNLSALLVVDASRSMDFPRAEPGTTALSKFVLARNIAAILGTLILDQGDAAGLLALAERTHYLPPRSGRQHLRLLLAELARVAPRGEAPVAEALHRASTLFKKQGLVLVLSDLYEEEAALGEIRKLRRMGHDVIVIHTLAAEELSLDIGGAAELVDLESGRRLLVQPSAARQQYLDSIGAWLGDVERAVRREGMDYLRVTTADALEPALRRFLVERRRAAEPMLWLNAAAFAGLALVALPLAIHLLVRQHTRTMAFPSLRFLRETALSAFRRRRLEDAWLFVMRVGVIAAAVAALAAPVLDTAWRRQTYATRISRAMIALDQTPDPDRIRGDAYRFTSFSRAVLDDAISDAVRWLNAQPPSARELVIAGELRRGAVFDSDLQAVPPDIGVRFVQSPPPQTVTTTVAVPILTQRNGALVLLERVVRADADSTHIISETVKPAAADSVRVVAPAPTQRLADAALIAALREGVPWPRDRARAVIVWDGVPAPPGEAQILNMPAPASAAAAPSAIWQTLARAGDAPVEPFFLSRDELDRWSRAPGPPAADAKPEDAGDRRWWWGAALLLLGVEQWLRR